MLNYAFFLCGGARAFEGERRVAVRIVKVKQQTWRWLNRLVGLGWVGAGISSLFFIFFVRAASLSFPPRFLNGRAVWWSTVGLFYYSFFLLCLGWVGSADMNALGIDIQDGTRVAGL